jgi:hypothetical protein
MMMKLRRATPPIAPPTMAPVLLGLADMDGWEAVVAPEGEGLSELLVESVAGCFVLGVGVVDCDSESAVMEPVVGGGIEVGLGLGEKFGDELGVEVGGELEVEVGLELGLELGGGVDTMVTVTDDAAWVFEIVFAA